MVHPAITKGFFKKHGESAYDISVTFSLILWVTSQYILGHGFRFEAFLMQHYLYMCMTKTCKKSSFADLIYNGCATLKGSPQSTV